VCILVLLHKATPVYKPQLGYMVNKLYKTFKLYKILNEGMRKWQGWQTSVVGYGKGFVE